MEKMKLLAVVFGLVGIVGQVTYAQHGGHSMPHEMQHGFVLSSKDKFASHLVAGGHHSRQTDVTGSLSISDPVEAAFYEERKALSAGGTYFLFQAQKLDLPSVKEGQVLVGHIVESRIGKYEPGNIIVKSATFTIDKVLLNLENPFFVSP